MRSLNAALQSCLTYANEILRVDGTLVLGTAPVLPGTFTVPSVGQQTTKDTKRTKKSQALSHPPLPPFRVIRVFRGDCAAEAPQVVD